MLASRTIRITGINVDFHKIAIMNMNPCFPVDNEDNKFTIKEDRMIRLLELERKNREV